MFITLAFLAFIGIPMVMLVLSVGRTVVGGTAAAVPQPRTIPRPGLSKRPVTVIDGEVIAPAPVPADLVEAVRAAAPPSRVSRPGAVVAFPRRPLRAAGERHSHAG